MNLILTPSALEKLIPHMSNGAWLDNPVAPDDGSWNVACVDRDYQGQKFRFLFSSEDKSSSFRVIIAHQDPEIWQKIPQRSYSIFASRMARIVLSATDSRNKITGSWGYYQVGKMVTFYPITESQGHFSWIAEIFDDSSVCFWKLTEQRVRIESFEPNHTLLKEVNHLWEDAFSECRHKLDQTIQQVASNEQASSFDFLTDFQRVVEDEGEQHSYSAWLPLLTKDQRRFIDMDVRAAIKLRGAAGTGKTLSLTLKAYHEIIKSRENTNQKLASFLFLTHGWPLSNAIESRIQAIANESTTPQEVIVMPLMAYTDLVMPAERRVPGFRPLGEDSESGEELEMELISDVIDAFRLGDWAVYSSLVSHDIIVGVSADRESSERLRLVWRLKNEFACVLSASSDTMFGMGAESKYIKMRRASWMMDLRSEFDRRFVYKIYEAYLRCLQERHLLSAGQLISDLLSYLRTYAWHLRRRIEGFDMIFVDELHLFNEQERLAINYLTNDGSAYPRIIMATDPKQSPRIIYKNQEIEINKKKDSGRSDRMIGEYETIELGKAFRFTKSIFRLIDHILQSYPAIELAGEEWGEGGGNFSSEQPDGIQPKLHMVASLNVEVEESIELSLRLSKGGQMSCAMVVINDNLLDHFSKSIPQKRLGKFKIIQERGDVETTRYSKGAIVMSCPEYVAGLQFDCVVVVGLPPEVEGSHRGLEQHSLLSGLYLACSRAKRELHIYFDNSSGEVPIVLESALSKGLLLSESGDSVYQT